MLKEPFQFISNASRQMLASMYLDVEPVLARKWVLGPLLDALLSLGKTLVPVFGSAFAAQPDVMIV
jgi:hypothetical protein